MDFSRKSEKSTHQKKGVDLTEKSEKSRGWTFPTPKGVKVQVHPGRSKSFTGWPEAPDRTRTARPTARKTQKEKEMEKIKISIPGEPPRVTHQSGIRHTSRGIIYKTPALKACETRYMSALLPYRPEEKITGPVSLKVDFIFGARRKNDRNRYKVTKPDTDNMVKTLKDVLTTCGYWKDDAQVVIEVYSKKYGVNPETKIEINELEEIYDENE